MPCPVPTYRSTLFNILEKVGKLEGNVILRVPNQVPIRAETGGVINVVPQKYVLVSIIKYYLCQKVLKKIKKYS